jgi:hypothetical protein
MKNDLQTLKAIQILLDTLCISSTAIKPIKQDVKNMIEWLELKTQLIAPYY